MTLLWGGCVSCEQYFMFGKSHGCCNPDGHCKTKGPGKSNPGRNCTQIAFEHQKGIDLHFDLPVAAATQALALPVRAIELLPRCDDPRVIAPSPPDLQLLHSTFLI